MTVGDKIVCKYTYYNFVKHKCYKVESIHSVALLNDYVSVFDDNGTLNRFKTNRVKYFSIPDYIDSELEVYIWDLFYTIKEARKLKIKELDENRG